MTTEPAPTDLGLPPTKTRRLTSANMRDGSDDAAGSEVQQIRPAKGWVGLDLPELWRYRELFYFLIWRDVKIRYKQTALGASWAILQPLMTMIVFTVFFGRLAGLDKRTGDIPYPLYVFAGLLPWTFFATAVNNSGNSLVNNANLITKVYFPRLVIPLAAVGAALVDLAISFVVLVCMMGWYQTTLTWQLVLLPVYLLGTIVTAMGVGTLLSALTVAYRDFRYVVPFMIQLWMFITPVIYPPSIVPERWRLVYSLNPMAGLIDGFRAAFFGSGPDWNGTSISLLVAFGVFIVGAVYFRRVERRFADIV